MNVLLIGIDSLRADRLGCYGYGRPTSPFMDGLAAQGLLFEQFFAPVIPTQPSFTTFFSGQMPTTHGIMAHRGDWRFADDRPFLPELFQAAGYATAAIDNLADHHQKDWFRRGFDAYINPREPGTYPDCFLYNRAAIEWLKHKGDRPFFMFVHYWDPHTPYLPPKSYRNLFYEGDPTVRHPGSLKGFYERPLMDWWPEKWMDRLAQEWPGASGGHIADIEFVRAQYDSEVRCADDGVREMVGALEEMGVLDDTAIVIWGDHGEELGEHGIYFDHHGLYESDIKVPLIVRWPGVYGRRIGALTQHMDLAPTILEGAGLSVPEAMDGQSLWPLIRGQANGRPDVLLTGECTWMAKWALRRDGWKVIVAREPDFYGKPARELYDLANDPGEQRNLAEDDPARAREMAAQLEDVLWARLKQAGRSEDPVAAHGITLGKKMFG